MVWYLWLLYILNSYELLRNIRTYYFEENINLVCFWSIKGYPFFSFSNRLLIVSEWATTSASVTAERFETYQGLILFLTKLKFENRDELEMSIFEKKYTWAYWKTNTTRKRINILIDRRANQARTVTKTVVYLSWK